MPLRFHELADARSLALHREVVRRLRAEPGLLEAVQRRVERWLENGEVASFYAKAWWDLLRGPPDKLFETLQSKEEHAVALRQASPFVGIVDARTRWRIWREAQRASQKP